MYVLLLLLISPLCITGSEKVAEYRGKCCDSLELETWGMADFYQEARLGAYSRYGIGTDGRPIYKQSTGPNFIFYLSSEGMWMVGHSVGQNYGGIRNKEDSTCPQDMVRNWEYWMDWTEEWQEDSDLEAKCQNGPTSGPNPTMPPDAESCTWGAACDGCNVWSEVNGVRYCCATNCDSGSLDVSTENGEVICWCNH